LASSEAPPINPTVDIRHGQQLAGIGGFHAAAVQNAGLLATPDQAQPVWRE
jgi:hypothetical protein